MAGNKIHKSKGKEDKNKSHKGKGQMNVGDDGPDHALLRKPVLTSITGFSQARKIYDWATEELKHLLSHECDILYECKVCRNIFRSLANFISHKRVYCKEQFKPSEHGHFVKAPSTINELLKIKHLEEEYRESLKENRKENATLKDNDERIPLTKDLTEIADKIARKNGLQNVNSEPQMILQEIPNSSVAVFQNLNTSEEERVDSMQKQVNELDNMLSRSLAVIQHDGNCKTKVLSQDTDNVIQISDDDDDDDQNGDTSDVLKCKTCDLQFSTQKTLKFHMKYKHVESRLVYPCPDCLEIFSTSWSVYRHLFKVHRKTAAQIRRLRESIQSKAFRMNNIPTFYERRRNNAKQAATRKMTEEERLDQENQAWMDNMEGDGSGPRCGGCGRAFERRAALVAHTHTCAPRSRARALAAKRIQIQIRRDYHKGPPLSSADHDDNKITEEAQAAPESTEEILPPTVDDVTDDPVEVGDADESSNDVPKSTDEPEIRLQESPEPAPCDVLLVPDDASPEKSPVLWDEPEERESSELSDMPSKRDIPAPIIRLPYARNAEESNLNALKQRIESDVEFETFLCKRCENRFGSLQELYDHSATHYKWMRYACKLCNYKHYTFEKLPEHVKVVHKLKGDKDFYFSTVKALDGPEALELSENTDDQIATNGNSPDSQRASRCSSDSSRLSDDCSSSSTRIESGAKKRKMQQSKVSSKRKKDSPNKSSQEPRNDNQEISPEKEKDVNLVEIEACSSIRAIEENSSDMDDADDKIVKRQLVEDAPSVASRRPVRRKTKPKNEDFEYDLSNLLKMEAQGYRDSQTNTTTKSNNTKKKSQEHQINYENLNKDCCGATVALSKNAVERSAAHMKMTSFSVYTAVREHRNSNLFVRPMLPKSSNKGDKISPKKDLLEDKKDNSSSPNKELRNQKVTEDVSKRSNYDIEDHASKDPDDNSSSNENNIKIGCNETVKTNLNKSTVIPFKLRGQSVGLFKNPLISKHIKGLTKPKLASKILVIKPFKRDPDCSKGLNTPVQYQTITVKDSNKDPLSENKSTYQKLLVEVPTVNSAIARNSLDTSVESKMPPVTSDASTESVTKSAGDSCEYVKNVNSSSDVTEDETSDKSNGPVISFGYKKTTV